MSLKMLLKNKSLQETKKILLKKSIRGTISLIAILVCCVQSGIAKNPYNYFTSALDLDYAGRDKEALENYYIAQTLYLEADSLDRYAQVTMNIGTLHYEYGLYEKSIEVYVNSLRHIANSKYGALIHRNIGKSYKALGEVSNSIDHYLESELICRQNGDSSGIGNIGILGLYSTTLDNTIKPMNTSPDTLIYVIH